MASIQARHSRACALDKAWTTLADANGSCTCKPTLYVVVREGNKLHRERVGKNRQTAERALRKVGTAVDEGLYEPQRRIRFDAWADAWADGLETKANTRRGYRSTLAYAKQAFGHKQVRQVTVDDVKRLLASMREEKTADPKHTKTLSDSTRAKHLRVLGACFASAIESGYCARNPVRALKRSEKPRAERKESAYFEADELRLLFAKVEPGVYRVLFLAALKTGMRLGELLALTWRDVELDDLGDLTGEEGDAGGILHVRRSFTDGYLGTPKNHERRGVHIAPELVELLGSWWGELGKPGEESLVFPGPTKNGFLNPKVVLAELYSAMAAAELPRVGPTGEKRTFHSFRHTFAKVALESGRPITWLKGQLGHHSITVTVDRYGHWEREARKREARQLQGAFGV